MVDILSTLCGVFMVQCAKLMLGIFEFGFSLFDCFIYRKNVTCLKRFTGYGQYAGEVEDKIVGRLAVVSQIAVRKIRAFISGLILC